MNWDSIAARLLSLGEAPLTARDRGFTAALLPLLSGEVPAPFAVRRFLPLPTLSYRHGDLHTGVPGERDFGPHVDQTNYSVVVDEQVVVKWLTPPVPLPHPTPEVLAHLVEAGFNDTAPPYAALTRAVDGREELLAVVTGYLPEARDGWEWCVDEAESGDASFASELGRLAADLHLALATLPVTGTAGVPLPERAEAALAQALELTDGEDGAWLAGAAARMRAELAPLRAGGTDEPAAPRIRIHGDLHVGQILRWRDGHAVIDFDGNPTVSDADPCQPAARDVAQLTTSLEHVAQVAIRRRGTDPGRAAGWAAAARAGLLAAYRARLAERHRPDLLDERLIRPFEVEQECRELIYAARHLPRWRYAPMGVLRTWYQKENIT
ncbi:aminoglycoside phosphotransferase [Nonomuraea phyllanthi]|uniref:Glucosamine kinase n=1 Tax=Nonomuraea phyllanthi TaxID=2219224 RepID=A0A5C4WWC8_9ACTN|nr:aminoglycoside phosphotransferase [Nonomuraea phyllanthi]KAB8197114.1 aminoglycoside phosphotransferase [Nonomuraea phyllanthi]